MSKTLHRNLKHTASVLMLLLLKKRNLRLCYIFGSQQTEDDTVDETLLEKLMQQETASDQDKQSILTHVQEEQIDAELQEFFAKEQVPAELHLRIA